MDNIWSNLKKTLTRSRENIVNGLNRITSFYKKIDEDTLESLEELLIQADIGVSSTRKIIDCLKDKVKKGIIKDTAEIKPFLQNEILDLLISSKNNINYIYDGSKKPFIVLVIGVNGVGKTTSIGKLAFYYKQILKKKVIVAAGDTFRAAAIEQLEVWCDRAECDIVKQKLGADPASVIYDSLLAAKSRNHDVVIIDTAGRLHTKSNLMEELKKIKRVVSKLFPDAPHLTLLVIDANTGQNALNQAREFNSAVGVNGLILTKLDSTAKGGIVISIKQSLDIPVYFIGTGEKIEDLQVFVPQDFARAIISEE